MRIAVYPGSFDPATNGHLDVLTRAAGIFDQVIVCVFRNAGKTPVFTPEERVEMLREATSHLPNVTVDMSADLTVRFAREAGAKVIIKGVRVMSDFESELKMAQMNKHLAPDIETVFITTATEYAFVSSSLVKEVASYGGNIAGLVPDSVAQRLRQRFGG